MIDCLVVYLAVMWSEEIKDLPRYCMYAGLVVILWSDSLICA